MPKKIPLFNIFFSIAAAILFVSFFYNQAYFTGRNNFPTGDQPDYLRMALDFKRYNKPAGFVQYLYSGAFKELRKHPLLVFIISPFSQKSLDFFVNAKFVNMGIGALLFICSFFLLKKLFGPFSALFFIFVLTVNESFLNQTALVVPDTLMQLLVLLTAYFYIKAVKDKSVFSAMAGSLFASLSYLTKPNGILLVLVFALYAVSIYRFKIFKSKVVLVSAFSFVLFSSPLFVRNIKLFGNPFYNNNVSLLWVENRQERRSPDFLQNPPTARDYISKTSVASELSLYAVNGVKMLSNLSMLVLFGAWRLRYSLPLILFTAGAFILDKDRYRAKFLAILFTVFYAFFAYTYKISPHYRHLMPISFIPISYIGFFIQNIVRRIARKRSGIFLIVFAWVLASYSLAVVGREGRLFNGEAFASQLDILDSHKAMRDWLEKNAGKDKVYVKGLDDRYMFEWYADIKGKRLIQPYFDNFDSFQKYLISNNVNFVVLTGPIAKSFPEIYSEYFVQTGEGNSKMIKAKKIPAGWSVKAAYRNEDHEDNEYKYVIFEID